MSEPGTLQNKRIPEIEIMRAFAIISMVFVHIHEMGSEFDLDSPQRYAAAYIIELLSNLHAKMNLVCEDIYKITY